MGYIQKDRPGFEKSKELSGILQTLNVFDDNFMTNG